MPGAEKQHIDMEEDRRTAYVHTDCDTAPHRQMRDRLKACAQNWSGMHALSPSASAFVSPLPLPLPLPVDDVRRTPTTRVVPLCSVKVDVTASVRPPSYARPHRAVRDYRHPQLRVPRELAETSYSMALLRATALGGCLRSQI